MIPISKLTRSALYLIIAATMLGSGVSWSQDMSPTRPLVILIGPPLSGKTTFVTAIQRDYGIPGISVEDLIKDHASELRKLHPEGSFAGRNALRPRHESLPTNPSGRHVSD